MKTFFRISVLSFALGVMICVPSCSNKHLVSINVSPEAPSVSQIGQTVQFQAMGTTNHPNAGQENLTSTATWASSTPSVAKIDKGGLATAVGCGTTSVTAQDEGVLGQTQLTVTCSGSASDAPPVLQSLSVYPNNPSIPQVGQQTQFIALGAYAPPSVSNNLSSLAQWASSNASIATVDSAGLATAVSCGQTTITAFCQGVLGQTQLTIACTQPPIPVLQSITLYPSNASIPQLGQTTQFIALGVYSPASSNNVLTSLATWASSNTSVATVNGGLATAGACGTTTITAEYQGVIGQVPLTVQCTGTQTLQSITVLPNAPTIPQIGQTTQFAAVGTLVQGGQTDLTSIVTWASSNTQVATIDTAGLATAVSCGTTTISAQSQNIVGSSVMSVSCTTAISIELLVIKTGLVGASIVSAPSGINCGTVCGALFFEGTGIALTATSPASSWQGCDQVSLDKTTCYLTIIHDPDTATQRKVTGNF